MQSLRSCPDKPNCVSSQAAAEDTEHFILPFTVKNPASWPQAFIEVLSAVRGITIVETDDNYIHAECRSLIFRFIDDLELLWDPRENICHVCSASRKGYSDLGVNRKRVEKMRQLLVSMA